MPPTPQEKPSAIIKKHTEDMFSMVPMTSCGIAVVDLLARHVAKLAAHADAVDAYLDSLTSLPERE